MPRLGVNIDHIASIRELRHGTEPDPVFAAFIAEGAGADSIVVHLREDRRHIKERDLYLLRQTIKTKLNLEMSIAPKILAIACKVRPDQATLVPEKRRELTTEGGLDVAGNIKRVKAAVARLKKAGIEVSLFIDPVKSQIEAAARSGAGIIELHTGRYADAKSKIEEDRNFEDLASAVKYGNAKGLVVNAGHGLNYCNTARVAKVRGIEELNIGYSIICRAALVGLGRAVKEMKGLAS